jgi:hypothetical protein
MNVSAAQKNGPLDNVSQVSIVGLFPLPFFAFARVRAEVDHLQEQVVQTDDLDRLQAVVVTDLP